MGESVRITRIMVLAAVLAAAVIVGVVGFSGIAGAEHGPTERGGETWHPNGSSSSGAVGPGAVLFQGEAGIETLAAGNGSAADFRHVSEDAVLELPIPEDQPTGTYEAQSNGDTLTVQSPEITEMEFLNPDGQDIRGGAIPNIGQNLTVRATYNFGAASDLAVEVFSTDAGIYITDEVVPDPADRVAGTADTDEDVEFPIDTAPINSGEYVIEVHGRSADLRHGRASQSDTVQIDHGPHPPEIDLNESSVARGEAVQFDIRAGLEGEHYLVAVPAVDLESVSEHVFRSVDTRVETGTTASYAYAIVEIDGSGRGVLASGYLETGEAEVQLRNINVSESIRTDADVEGSYREDRQTIQVDAARVELEGLPEELERGEAVSISGSTSSEVARVTVYARDDADYGRVAIDGKNSILVQDGSFALDGVHLNEGSGPGNDVLDRPGDRRLAIVAGPGPQTLSPTELSARAPDVAQLTVVSDETPTPTMTPTPTRTVTTTQTATGTSPGPTETDGSETPAETATADRTSVPADGGATAGETGPGFGPVAALVGAVACGLLVRRRKG